MPVGWIGEKVRLVPLEHDKHFENALRWANDPEVTALTLMGDLPIGRLAEAEWFERQNRGTERDVLFAIEVLGSNEHIGFSGLHRIDWRHGMAHTGTMIGRSDLWGSGYGSDATRVRTRYAFETLGLRLLLSEVLADNTGSLVMLERAGYARVGLIPRKVWKRGAYRDVVLLAIERPT